MTLFDGLNDDQIALLGCVVAFLGSVALMSLSYYLGRNRSGASDTAPPTITLPLRKPETTTEETRPVRRAA